MAHYKIHFTVGEARALLPDVRERFARIHALLAEIETGQDKSAEPMRIHRGNGKGPIVQAASPRTQEVHKEIETLVELGIQIKDLQAGLIDFPHFLDGKVDHEVFLCYIITEPTIGFWHEIDEGFSGRSPI